MTHTGNYGNRSIGSSIKQRLEEIYKEYGRYLNKVDSFEFPGLTGMEKMASIMQKLRDEPITELAGHKVVKVTDYKKPEETGLPAANVLIYGVTNDFLDYFGLSSIDELPKIQPVEQKDNVETNLFDSKYKENIDI